MHVFRSALTACVIKDLSNIEYYIPLDRIRLSMAGRKLAESRISRQNEGDSVTASTAAGSESDGNNGSSEVYARADNEAVNPFNRQQMTRTNLFITYNAANRHGQNNTQLQPQQQQQQWRHYYRCYNKRQIARICVLIKSGDLNSDILIHIIKIHFCLFGQVLRHFWDG